ncbi:MAG TPA: SDR family NAD(P)-dependent oxidoreductase [Conexibacter sp.]|jgi:NAD(P)-dependent dehydrogenase (short-subunit alcohol dehydrogenase family)
MPSLQQPIGSGFSAASSAADVIDGVDLSGKVAIVTGGDTGVGVQTTRALRSAGATVVVPARSPQRARAALAGIDGVEVEQLDLLDPASVDAFASRFLDSRRPLHMLVDAAGIHGVPLARDGRGYESQLSTNHLGHYQLAMRLWPALLLAGGARVMSVSAQAHRLAGVDFDDPQFERRDYDRWLAYGQSKTANVLFALALDSLGEPEGVRAFAPSPCTIAGASLSPWLTREQLQAMGVVGERGQPLLDPARGCETIAQAASTIVWCATSPELDGVGGVYCENNEVAPIVPVSTSATAPASAADREKRALGVAPHAIDPESANRLWELSERLTGSSMR